MAVRVRDKGAEPERAHVPVTHVIRTRVRVCSAFSNETIVAGKGISSLATSGVPPDTLLTCFVHESVS
jgi:hypothetical protein